MKKFKKCKPVSYKPLLKPFFKKIQNTGTV